MRLSAIVVACRDGKVLAVRQMRKRPFSRRWEVARGWSFPGGKVEQGETPREAAVREFREEVGVEHFDLTWGHTFEAKSPSPEPAVYIYVFHCLRITDLEHGKPERGTEVAWVDPSKLTGPEGAFPKFYRSFFDRYELGLRTHAELEARFNWSPVLASLLLTAFFAAVLIWILNR